MLSEVELRSIVGSNFSVTEFRPNLSLGSKITNVSNNKRNLSISTIYKSMEEEQNFVQLESKFVR